MKVFFLQIVFGDPYLFIAATDAPFGGGEGGPCAVESPLEAVLRSESELATSSVEVVVPMLPVQWKYIIYIQQKILVEWVISVL